MCDQTIPLLPDLPAGCILSPEFRLAVACSWIAPEPLDRLQGERVASLCAAGIDWDAFLALVDRHGISVQTLSVLRRCRGEGIPEQLYRELEERRKKTVVRSTMQMAELIRINRLLRKHGIDIIPLKGGCLSQRLYGTLGVRTSSDIDILIRQENLTAADRILTAFGYRKLYDLTKRQTAAFLAHAHHVNYYREGSGPDLELHWRIHFWSRDEMEEFWRGRETVVMMGEPFAFIDDSLLFLFLCDHGSGHAWFRMKWLSDITMMIANEKIRDWDALIARADSLGLRRILAQTALLVHWLYGIPLPSQLSGVVVSEKTASGLAKKGVADLLLGADELVSRMKRFAGLRAAIYHKRIRPSLPYRLLLAGLFISPADYITFPLPDSLFWMYLPLRPFVWFWRHYGKRIFSGEKHEGAGKHDGAPL